MQKKPRISQWIHCPVCHSKTRTRIYDDTVLLNFPLYCSHCKREFCICVVQGKMTVDETKNEKSD